MSGTLVNQFVFIALFGVLREFPPPVCIIPPSLGF